MSTPETRLAILRELVDREPSVAAFARKHDLDATYLRQLLNGHRSFGEKAAQKMGEKVAGNAALFEGTGPMRPSGQSNVTSGPMLSSDETELLAAWRQLASTDQAEIMAVIEERAAKTRAILQDPRVLDLLKEIERNKK